MAEGIEYLLKEQMERLPSTADFDQWLKAVKTKRFTYTRLSRLACALLLDLTPAELKEYDQAPYMRLEEPTAFAPSRKYSRIYNKNFHSVV